MANGVGSDNGGERIIGGPPKMVELRLKRSTLHREYDLKRLQDGKEDLNDALLDFFVKLGQAVIPCGGLEGGFPSVAYLGSFFFDVLQKGDAKDGRAGHANVANWAKRRLGQGGLFFDGIGALAVPVNEQLTSGSLKERHWWLALLLNPRGGGRPEGEEAVSVVCLDSLARAETRCEPPVRAVRYNTGYSIEVMSLYRQSFSAIIRFRARGDGTAGAIPSPHASRLLIGGREFSNPSVDLVVTRYGDYGTPGLIEGVMDFSLDSSAPTSGEYELLFGPPGGANAVYNPPVRIRVHRDPSTFQRRVATFLGGYVGKEWEASKSSTAPPYDSERVTKGLRIPDAPQQETANDCGFFMLEQILLALQLTPDSCRTLAGFRKEHLAALPWPTQRDIGRRKGLLREAVESLFAAADAGQTDNVEALLVGDPNLRNKVQTAMWDGPRFAEAVRTIAATMAPRKVYTFAELEAMPTKALRAACTQYGVLPHGTVERADLLKVLLQCALKPEPSPSPSPSPPPQRQEAATATANGVGNGKVRGAGEPASGEAEAKRLRTDACHLGSLRFTNADLDSMPLKRLRDLCRQKGVMPANALERADFAQVLRQFAADGASAPNGVAAPAPAPAAAAGAVPSANGSAAPQAPAAAPAPVAAAAAPAAAPAASSAPETLVERKARWARVAAEQQHLATLTFEAADLEVMPIKLMRSICAQRKVLPPCAVERADFVQALTPLISSASKLAAAAAPASAANAAAAARAAAERRKAEEPPRRDFSKFLGSATPNFSMADLDDMPVSTLRTLCIKHGCLPPGEEVLRETLHGALCALVSRTRPATNDLKLDDLNFDE